MRAYIAGIFIAFIGCGTPFVGLAVTSHDTTQPASARYEEVVVTGGQQ